MRLYRGSLLVIMYYIVIYTILLLCTQVIAENCITPNNETAQCVSLFSCPIILNAVQKQEPGAAEFYGNSTCGGTVINPLVCCGTSATFAKRKPQVIRRKLWRYDSMCGLQHSDEYHHTTNETLLTEFPWFAKIKLKPKNPNDTEDEDVSFGFRCSGALITLEYVITSASCITDKKYEPELVRLGEYSLLNNTDCIEDSHVYECSNTVQDFGIKEVIPHPLYQKTELLFTMNDIGLIKLNGKVDFTDYVRPICLPSSHVPKMSADRILVTIKMPDDDSNIKPKLYRKYVKDDECRIHTSKKVSEDFVHDGHLCAAVLNRTEDFCEGNNRGSPIMASRRSKGMDKWYVVGIVAGKYANCILTDVNIYTKVVYYLEWIEENIKLNTRTEM